MVEVKWSNNRGPAQRVHDRLAQGKDAYPLKPSAQTETHHITRTKIYYGSSQAPSDKGHGTTHDAVDAAVASVGGVRPK
jgi:hypothetical protein